MKLPELRNLDQKVQMKNKVEFEIVLISVCLLKEIEVTKVTELLE